MGFESKGFFPNLGGPTNNLTPIRSCPDGANFVYLDPRVLRNVHVVTLKETKRKIYFGILELMDAITYFFLEKKLI